MDIVAVSVSIMLIIIFVVFKNTGSDKNKKEIIRLLKEISDNTKKG